MVFVLKRLEASAVAVKKVTKVKDVKVRVIEAVAQRCSIKKVFLEICTAYNYMKKRLWAQVFSCEFCEIFKNNFFTKHLLATVSLRVFLQ